MTIFMPARPGYHHPNLDSPAVFHGNPGPQICLYFAHCNNGYDDDHDDDLNGGNNDVTKDNHDNDNADDHGDVHDDDAHQMQ